MREPRPIDPLAADTMLAALHLVFGLVAGPLAARRPSCHVAMCDAPWRDAEDWALVDAAPQFTVGQKNDRRTFWSALAASTPELAARSAAECELRARSKDEVDVGSQPAVLEDWCKLEDGRYTGRVAGEDIGRSDSSLSRACDCNKDPFLLD